MYYKEIRGSNEKEKNETNWNLNFDFTTLIYLPYDCKHFFLESSMMNTLKVN